MSDTHTKTTRALVSGQRGELELRDVHFRRAAATAAAVSVPAMEERGIKMSITAVTPDRDRKCNEDIVSL